MCLRNQGAIIVQGKIDPTTNKCHIPAERLKNSAESNVASHTASDHDEEVCSQSQLLLNCQYLFRKVSQGPRTVIYKPTPLGKSHARSHFCQIGNLGDVCRPRYEVRYLAHPVSFKHYITTRHHDYTLVLRREYYVSSKDGTRTWKKPT